LSAAEAFTLAQGFITTPSGAQNLVYATPNGSSGNAALRALVAADVPTLNQNTSGTAANLSGTPALPNGTTATTQSAGDTSTKIATDAFVMGQGFVTATTAPVTSVFTRTGAVVAGANDYASVASLTLGDGSGAFIGFGTASEPAIAGSVSMQDEAGDSLWLSGGFNLFSTSGVEFSSDTPATGDLTIFWGGTPTQPSLVFTAASGGNGSISLGPNTVCSGAWVFSTSVAAPTIQATSAFSANGTAGLTHAAGAPTSLTTKFGLVTAFSTSDERLKKDIVPFERGLESLLNVKPITYRWRDNQTEYPWSGFSAQQVAESIPEASPVMPDGMHDFHYQCVLAVAVNAIKQLTARVVKLETSK
jgi:hypothetical protein